MLENFWRSDKRLGKENVRWDDTVKGFNEVKAMVLCLKGAHMEEASATWTRVGTAQCIRFC